MYQVEFDTFLPATTTKITVIAYCRAIINYNIIGLSFKFINDDGDVLKINYDKEFFSDIEDEANEALLEEYYNHSNIRVN